MHTCLDCDESFEKFTEVLQHIEDTDHSVLKAFDKDDEEADFTEIEELKRGR